MNDDAKTGAYQQPDANATSLYGNVRMEENASQSTSTYSSPEHGPTSKTATYSSEKAKTRRHNIGVGDDIILNGLQYIITRIISESTGEAVIYQVKDTEGRVLVLKLYFEFSNEKEEPNSQTLKRIMSSTCENILRLYDFGTGLKKYKDKYCFEIAEFAEGGDLWNVRDIREKYSPTFLEKKLIPQMVEGITYLHDCKVYHCDLKPANFLYGDKEQSKLLIADYGSAKAYDLESVLEIRKSSTIKGTDAYLAPEQARGIISEKNDYYSLGMILFHLLYPEEMGVENNYPIVDRNKFDRIIQRQFSALPLIEYKKEFERLNLLIAGLTLSNPQNRWGRKEVRKWLDHEWVEVKYSQSEKIVPIKLGFRTIFTPGDLLEVVGGYQNWYEELILDPDVYMQVKTWLSSIRNIPDMKIFDGMVRFYQPLGKVYVKEAVCRYFEPSLPLVFDNQQFKLFESSNIQRDVENYLKAVDLQWKKLSVDALRFAVFQLEFALKQLKLLATHNIEQTVGLLLDKLISPVGLSPNNFQNYATQFQEKISLSDTPGAYRLFINVFHSFNRSRGFRDLNNNELNTLEDLGTFFMRYESLFDNVHLKTERDRFLLKIGASDLVTLKYKELMFQIFKDRTISRLELVNVQFDKHRRYDIGYKFYKVMSEIKDLSGNTINLSSKSNNNEVLRVKGRLFQSPGIIFNHFIKRSHEIHRITSISKDNYAKLKSDFNKMYWKRFAAVHWKQAIALILLTTSVVYFGLIYNHSILIRAPWNYEMENAFKEKAAPQRKAVTVQLYTVIPNRANVRDIPSKNGKVVLSLSKGSEVEFVDSNTPGWYRIKYYDQFGYISDRLVKFSRSKQVYQ